MAKNWYPIIDYSKCTGCLSCVKFCPHDVYKVKDEKPVVAAPENCVEFCRGCQKGACQYDAITYYGDKEKKEGTK
ncbi:MAG TPA: ferredoxin family protein [bacterium]|nr:ferredoxin family protein [bacterium]HPP30200.1 ferredoxin family protein [bacterium]